MVLPVRQRQLPPGPPSRASGCSALHSACMSSQSRVTLRGLMPAPGTQDDPISLRPGSFPPHLAQGDPCSWCPEALWQLAPNRQISPFGWLPTTQQSTTGQQAEEAAAQLLQEERAAAEAAQQAKQRKAAARRDRKARKQVSCVGPRACQHAAAAGAWAQPLDKAAGVKPWG